MKSVVVLSVVLIIVTLASCNVLSPVRPRIPLSIGERVLGGTDASPNEHPSIVSLQYDVDADGTTQHFCGAVIIDASWIITAAHCLYINFEVNELEAVGGAHNWNIDEDTQQRRNIDAIYPHPYFGGGASPYDIGLAHLSIPFTFNAYVSYIDLPEPDTIHSGNVKFYGWGSTTTATGLMSNILQSVDMQIIPYVTCELAVGGPGATPIHPNNLCTGPLTGGVGTCAGDAGGPLLQGVELVGLGTWFFSPCGTIGAPSVFTRVSAYNEWIFSIIATHPNKR